MNAPQVRVWTRDELLDIIKRPKVRDVGVPVRIAARFTPRPNRPEDAKYELISPCCGKRTFIAQWFVDRLDQFASGGTFECGKPWAAGRGNPRNGGCRAEYAVRVGSIVDGHAETFDLTWTGHGEISRHPGGSGPTRWRS